MRVITTKKEMATIGINLKNNGKKIGFLPTMGGLHKGHTNIINTSKEQDEVTIISIFVNPNQFSPNEDLKNYPCSIENDIKLCQEFKVDYLFIPTAKDIYSSDNITQIKLGGPTLGLESDFRPNFFSGVALIVLKLLNIIKPTTAYFGEKDFQQLIAVKKMVNDLDLDCKIVSTPTYRKTSGLAFSTRNQYLSKQQQTKAAKLFYSLNIFGDTLNATHNYNLAQQEAYKCLQNSGFGKIDYLCARTVSNLETLPKDYRGPIRILGATYLDQVRLIDNIPWNYV